MGQVELNRQIITYDDEFSFKDYTNQPCLGDISNKVIYATCFSHEIPESVVFADNVTDVTFVKCNLDNCLLPANSTVIECSQREWIVQNDNNDWLIDNNGNPVEPINKKYLEQQGLFTNPKDIPVAYIEEQTMTLEEYEAKYGTV